MARKKEPAKIGRPPVVFDVENLKKLGALHCTTEEVAAFFNCTKRTAIEKLKNEELRLAFETGKQLGKLNLRRLQNRHAQGVGSAAVNMTIHLSKHHLGQTEKASVELSGRDGGPIETRDVSARQLVASRIASIAARRAEGAGPPRTDGKPS